MATIAENLNEIKKCKQDIKNSIINKGVEPTGGLNTYSAAIDKITTGGTVNNQNKTVDIIKNGTETVSYDPEYTGLGQVTINTNVPIPTFETEELTATENKVYTPTKDGYSKVTVAVPIPVEKKIESRKTVNIVSNGTTNINPSSGFDGLEGVDLNVDVPTGGASFDWEGTGYNATTQATVNNKIQADIDYTKQKYAEWDPSRTDANSLYQSDKKLVYAPNIDLKNVTTTPNMFNDCYFLTTIPDGFNCPKATDTSNMFNGCSSLTALPDGFNCPKATDTSNMFNGCSSLTALPDGFNCPESTNTKSMFESCSSLTSLPDGFNCPETTNTYQMFYGCKSLTALPDGFNCPKATSTSFMFSNCKSLTALPDGFNCPETTSTSNMFNGCSSLTALPDGFNCPLTTSTYNMFNGCSSLTALPDGFSCPETTNTYQMFGNCESLTALPDGFTCPLTTRTSYMFYNCSSLKSLLKLDFGRVTDISNFFGHDANTLTDLGGFTGLKIDWNDSRGLNKCPNLTKQSVLNVINELYDFRANGDASTTKTIQFHANSLALLSEDEKLIATNKGWNLVS